MNQFNGKYGCPICLNPGTRVASQYYLPGPNYNVRSNDSVIEDADEAAMKRETVHGIKGPSVL